MPQFVPGQPIETETPVVEVTVTRDKPLPPGQHRFHLIVTDDAGNVPTPAVVEVVVRDSQKPTAVLDAPRQVEAGQSFQLSGSRSTDIAPGRIVRYQWMMLS
jgi:hypothetical protein